MKRVYIICNRENDELCFLFNRLWEKGGGGDMNLRLSL